MCRHKAAEAEVRTPYFWGWTHPCEACRNQIVIEKKKCLFQVGYVSLARFHSVKGSRAGHTVESGDSIMKNIF